MLGRSVADELLTPWFTELIMELELAHWDITAYFERRPDDVDATAEICITPGRNQATLVFGDHFFTLNKKEMKEVAIHELLHLHHRALTQFRGRLVVRFGMIIGQLLCDELTDAEEWAVDAIAVAIAKHFPDPPIPD